MLSAFSEDMTLFLTIAMLWTVSGTRPVLPYKPSVLLGSCSPGDPEGRTRDAPGYLLDLQSQAQADILKFIGV